MLLVKLSGSPVRRRLDGRARSSLKVRGIASREALARAGPRIHILELQGALFFGTAHRLQAEVEATPAGAGYLILDFRRVNQIDASGVRMVEVIVRRAARRGVRVLLSHVGDHEPLGRILRGLGLGSVVEPGHWFTDLDHALEWAEDRLLEEMRVVETAAELPPERTALFEGLDHHDASRLASRLERHVLADGEAVFREGDCADRLYLIAQGTVSIKVGLEDAPGERRLATFTPGVMFGEMALLEGEPRSADAFAKGPTVVLYSLAERALAELLREDAKLGMHVYRAVSLHLASRLRATTVALRALD
jgi:anti-anti-sigma regulatory factor